MTVILKNKITLITGASSGFGADAARLFARQGCIVVLAARRMERLTSLADEIMAEGGEAFPLALDITVQSQIDEVVRVVLERYGRIDILVNNAGLGRLDWFERLDPLSDIDRQVDINLRGLIQLTHKVLPSMLSHRQGTIINIGSVGGLIAAPTYTIYAATKFGVRGFTDALRREVAPFGIHVCGLYPGPARTEFSLHTGDAAVSKNLKTPAWFYMSSEYVARRTVDLARHPRRTLVIPGYYQLAVLFEAIFPGLVDWILKVGYVKRFHKLEE